MQITTTAILAAILAIALSLELVFPDFLSPTIPAAHTLLPAFLDVRYVDLYSCNPNSNWR